MLGKSDIHVETVSPADAYGECKSAFEKFVVDAGEVNAQTLANLIEQAATLVMLYDGKNLIGTSAIKRPHNSHRSGDFKKAQVAEQAAFYPLELGWIVVHPDYRRQGHAATLIREALGAMDDSEGVYATTKTERMRALLPEFGFEVLGEPYPSTLNKEVNLTLLGRRAGQ